ncbi:MAG: hypothetical protein IJX08_06255 [Clostridia bacterium]|nr:hypothetical protein [Clostridia bacterium]
MDWQQVRAEYITTDTSYRKLAEKYGVSYTTVGERARNEGWAKEREQYQTKTLSKTLNKLSAERARRTARLFAVTDKLLLKVEKAVDSLDDDQIDTQAFRQIAASLKDIKDIQMIKSEADMREQEARIKNLQRQAVAEEASKEINVTMEGDLEQYST